jgi:hypothetical protein
MIGRIFQSIGFVIGIIVFIVVTVAILYVSYLLAIGMFLLLMIYTTYQVLTGLRKAPSVTPPSQ